MNRERFTGLWHRVGGHAQAARADAVFQDLLARYREPHRRYHTEAHIDHCLAQHDLAAASMADPDAVELALWFHDAIYRVGAPDNERRSADLLAQAAGTHLGPARTEHVRRLIVVTEHLGPPGLGDEGFVCDIDLSSFGLPWAQFVRDSRAVREECAMFADEVFYPRQVRFLEGLLARSHLYATAAFRARYEAQARDNIRRYIEETRVLAS